MTARMGSRPVPRPKITDRLNAWALAYDAIRSMTGGAVSPDAMTLASAILAVGVDVTDPHLAQAAQLIGWGKEQHGHTP